MGSPCWELVYCFSCSILQEEQEEVKLLVGLTAEGEGHGLGCEVIINRL